MNKVLNTIPIEIRYKRARNLIRGIWTKKIAYNTTLFPVWIGDSSFFWYIRETRCGKEYRLVDAIESTNEIAFNHQTLAKSLSKVSKKDVDANNLPIINVEIQLNPTIISFTTFSKCWKFELSTNTCLETGSPSPLNEIVSPDGKYVAIRRDYNLWLRKLATGEEKALTTDGMQFSEYADVNQAWGVVRENSSSQMVWSPDSKRIFTVQRDARNVKTVPVVHHVPKNNSIRPTVEHFKLALPGDEHVETNRLVVIDVETGRHQPATYNLLPTTRNSWGFFEAGLGWWNKDSRLAYFVEVDRWYKYARVVEFNTDTGSCRVLFEESTITHINLMLNQDDLPTLLPLPETNELLWFSERTGWAHLYLYDLANGKMKNSVTSGPGLVRDIVRYVPKSREVFVQMAGRVEGRNPYYRQLVRTNIDTGEMTLLVDSDDDYVSITERRDMMKLYAESGHPCNLSCGVSKNGRFAVVTRSRADKIPVSFLVDKTGENILDLEMADVSALPEGWVWPEPVTLESADGRTNIYGLIYRPSNFDSNKSWPVISSGFNQPEIPWVPEGSFTNNLSFGWQYLDAAALAELGFIVVQVDGRGSPGREKTFFDQSYGWFESASNIDDHAAAIKQLAQRYPYIDINRVGVAAYTTGGSGAIQGLLKYPKLYKVGVTSSYHDRRLMSGSMQSEKYEGPTVLEGHHEYPENHVDNLQGKLLMMIGMLDTCTLPAATFRLVEALQKANKDFDLLLLPCLEHVPNGYMIRRAWDYLVKNLIGTEPPKEFKLDDFFL